MFVDLCGGRLPGPRAALRGRRAPLLARPAATACASRRASATPRATSAEIDTRRRPLGRRELVRARELRHVRHPLRGSSRPAPHPHVPGVRGAPAAQGLPGRTRPSRSCRTASEPDYAREARAVRRRRGHAASGARPTTAVGGAPTTRTETELMEPIDHDLDEAELELPTEPMLLNMGPSHPAMHGTVRIVLELDGETIVQARRADRLPAPRLREDVRARHLDAGLPVRRSAATTSRRCSTTSASRSRSRSCSASRCPSAASTTA